MTSSNKYKTRYGATFSVGGVSKHSFADLKLYPKEPPEIPPGKVKTHIVDIPGRDGSLDLSEALTGYPTYETRTATWSFVVHPRVFSGAMTRAAAFLHGKRAEVVPDEEPDARYRGRLSMDKPKCDALKGIITIKGELEPFKYVNAYGYGHDTSSSVYSSVLGRYINPWLWDPFSFINGVIRDYSRLFVTAGETATHQIVSSPRGGTITASSSMAGVKITINGGEEHTFEDSFVPYDFPADILPRGVETVDIVLENTTGTNAYVQIKYEPAYL